MTRHRFRTALSLFLAALLSACAAWPERPTVTAGDQQAAAIDGYGQIRLWQDAPADQWLVWREELALQRLQSGRGDAREMLAISSGSDKGAFSAGYLKGWSEAGTRPQFDIVSGVSTGALIAPFAFLGEGYDPHLANLFTGITARNIYRAKPLEGLFGGPALADTAPLIELIALYADEALIDAVAREHRAGRRLLVQTTNLDAERGVVWDMGAIAASENPARYRLFRQVLLASASIPGAFPPVLIDVSAPNASFSELHVDGGTTSGVLVFPPSVIFSQEARQQRQSGRVTVLYNGALAPVYQVAEPSVFEILSRALTTSLKSADQRSIQALRAFAQGTDLAINVQSLGGPAEEPDVELFDQDYMKRLYALGRERALKGER